MKMSVYSQTFYFNLNKENKMKKKFFLILSFFFSLIHLIILLLNCDLNTSSES